MCMAVGDRILELLQSRDMTQKQLATDLSLPLTTLNGYVRNYREPDYATLKLLADYFEVSCDFLLDHALKQEESVWVAVLSPEEAAFLKDCRSLRPDQKELLYSQVELMLRQNQKKG